jgi:hypothetical protein
MSRKGRHGRSRNVSSGVLAKHAKGNRLSPPTPEAPTEPDEKAAAASPSGDTPPVNDASGATPADEASGATPDAPAAAVAEAPVDAAEPSPAAPPGEPEPEPKPVAAASASEAPPRADPPGAAAHSAEVAHQTPLAFAQPDASTGGSPGDEDSSYPPVDLDADFFASTPRSHADHHPSYHHHVDIDERDPRVALKLTPGVARRRQQLAKYVKIAVGLSSALCLAALVKVAVAGRGDGDVPRKHAATSSAPTAQLAAAEPPVQAAATEPIAQAATVAPSAEPPSTEPAPGAAAQQGSPKEGDTPAPAPPPREEAVAQAAAAPQQAPEGANAAADPASAEVDPEQAKKEKTTSRVALERGKLADAIAAGERAVALDPTDGESWLILGAAYQTKGNAKDARRCYKACVEQGKRGPRGECGAMLR